jgi:hypothetical protein
MTQNPQLASLTLQLDASDESNPEEIHNLSYELFGEINELDIESAEFVTAEEVPDGAKGISVAPEIAVSVFMPIAIEVLKTCYIWLKRREDRNIKIKSIFGEEEIELLITSKGYQKDEVERFIELMTRSENVESKRIEF